MVRVRREIVVEYSASTDDYSNMTDDEIRDFELRDAAFEEFLEYAEEVCVTVDIDPEVSE